MNLGTIKRRNRESGIAHAIGGEPRRLISLPVAAGPLEYGPWEGSLTHEAASALMLRAFIS